MPTPAELLETGIPDSVSDTEATELPKITTPEATPTPKLVRYERGIDIAPDLTGLHESIVRGRMYEDVCFKDTVAKIGQDQYAFGPGIIDAAMMGMKRPDALVFNVTSDGLVLAKMWEYRMGQLHTGKKLGGFIEFTRSLRENPDGFSRRIGETVGQFPLIPLIVPEDDEIKVGFINSRFERPTGEPIRIHNYPFPVNYSRVESPIPEPEAA